MNLHGSYPTSTSRAFGSGTELEALLAMEARTLLMAAASGIPVESERMRAFARACLEVSEVGRLALAVLDGGVFAPRRALNLANTVCDAVGAATSAGKTAGGRPEAPTPDSPRQGFVLQRHGRDRSVDESGESQHARRLKQELGRARDRAP